MQGISPRMAFCTKCSFLVAVFSLTLMRLPAAAESVLPVGR